MRKMNYAALSCKEEENTLRWVVRRVKYNELVVMKNNNTKVGCKEEELC